MARSKIDGVSAIENVTDYVTVRKAQYNRNKLGRQAEQNAARVLSEISDKLLAEQTSAAQKKASETHFEERDEATRRIVQTIAEKLTKLYESNKLEDRGIADGTFLSLMGWNNDPKIVEYVGKSLAGMSDEEQK